MKIERLIGILSVLLQQDKVTAPYLAEKFEVSRRTINRDIESLCIAGIPIATERGIHGGISIMSGYKIDKTLFTSKEMQAMLSGLKSLDSISGENRYKLLMDKLSPGSADNYLKEQNIYINLTSWYKDTLAPKFELIQHAIEQERYITFCYYAPDKKSTQRKIEPYFLVFEWSSWYVFGYCINRNDFRMFKLNRMVDIIETNEIFEKRNEASCHLMEHKTNSADRDYFHQIHAKVLFKPEMEWRLIEEYGLFSYEKTKDNKLLMDIGWSDEKTFFSWILGFREGAEIVEPESLRKSFFELVEEIAKNYTDKN